MKVQLQQLRKAKGLTQEEIASILDVKLSTYQKYERDAISPPYDTLIKIADFYDVTTDYLLGRDTPIPTYLTSSELAFENALIERYKQLPEHFRKSFLQGVMEAVDYYQQELQELPQESTMVAVETAGDFRKRKEEQENDELEAQRKETA
jgi:transcriptional regulator with XRE-family HTH domain